MRSFGHMERMGEYLMAIVLIAEGSGGGSGFAVVEWMVWMRPWRLRDHECGLSHM